MTDSKWNKNGFMFVIIASESLKNYRIYCFNANLLKWSRIEWIKFPTNHASIIRDGLIEVDNNNLLNLGVSSVCLNTIILSVSTPNTLLLISSYRSRDTDEQVTAHRRYYRLKVG
jgi:hypothetical protein